MSDDILDRYSRGNTPTPIADGSFTPTDIFNKYDRAVASPSDVDTLEASASKTEPVKQGRGIIQALIDYPGHVLSGLKSTVTTPGDIMTKNPYPPGSESWQFFENNRQDAMIPSAFNLAGLATGSEFPKAAGASIAEKVAPSSQAVNKLVDAIEPQNVPALVNRLKEDPTLTLADASPTVRQLTQGLIDPAQPKAQNTITSAINDRIANRKGEVESAYTKTMGAAPNVPAMVEGLKAKARKIGDEAIQPVLENAKLVDTSPVIKAIDDKLEPGINPLLSKKSELPLSSEQEELARFKQQLISGDGEQLFDAKRLHSIQSDMGTRAYQLSKSPDPKDRLLGSQLRDMNEKLVDQIDKASGPVPIAAGNVRVNLEGGKYVDVPQGRAGLEKLADPEFVAKNAKSSDVGAYRAGRAKFKEAKDIDSAFESGFDTLKNRSGLSGAMEDSPDAFRNWMKSATPEEIVARRIGTRADINQKINGVKNGALAGETVTKIPYNQDKLKMLFGDQEASRLIRLMENSSDKSATNAAILGGSHTARIQAGQKALAVPEVGAKGGNALQNLGMGAGLAEGASYLAAPLLGGYLPGAGALLAAGGRGIGWAASRGIQKGLQLNALARNAEFAKQALGTGATRQNTINALLSHPKVVRELQKSSNALTAP